MFIVTRFQNTEELSPSGIIWTLLERRASRNTTVEVELVGEEISGRAEYLGSVENRHYFVATNPLMSGSDDNVVIVASTLTPEPNGVISIGDLYEVRVPDGDRWVEPRSETL